MRRKNRVLLSLIMVVLIISVYINLKGDDENMKQFPPGITIQGDKAIIDGNIIGGVGRSKIASELVKLGYKVYLKKDNLTYF